MTHRWDPVRYLTYAGERGRPFVDLLAQVGATDPSAVVDLGCGPGNLTSLLADRWPEAAITGLDSSPEMIAAATDERITWTVGDLADWQGTADVVVSNATLQWVPGHLDLLPGLAGRVRQWLAFQVPGNFDEPSHAILGDLASRAPYDDLTGDVVVPSSHDPEVYYDALAGQGWRVDAWETTYLHVLSGPDPVFTWVSGTGARPTLQALPEGLRQEFERDYQERLAAAYPTRADGTVLLPFRRIFVVAHR